MRTYAEVAGCSDTTECADGESALAAAASQRFDAAILDFHMPGIDGLETLRGLLAQQPSMTVVAWTSVLDPAIEAAFVEAGALCHIPKTDTVGLRAQLERLCAAQAPCGVA